MIADQVAFLRARLDEVEAIARAAAGGSPRETDMAVALHIGTHDPARVLREVNAVRELLRHLAVGIPGRPLRMEVEGVAAPTALFPEWLLKPFVAIYSDHPDYRQEWAP